MSKHDNQRISAALNIATRYGQIDGEHHKSWVIDQMCRELLGDKYAAWVADHNRGEDGDNTYVWEIGIAP